MKILTCIVCPIGCKIKVDENGNINGARCDRGINFVKRELLSPQRILTTTVKIEDGIVKVLPVKSSAPIPKERLREVVKEISRVSVKAPIHIGDTIYEMDSIKIIATRSVDKKNNS
jgi:CxxC motif-containing protein